MIIRAVAFLISLELDKLIQFRAAFRLSSTAESFLFPPRLMIFSYARAARSRKA